MTATKIAVIGGSGIYEIDGLDGAEWTSVETPWGVPSDQILTGTLDGVDMAFLPRHGRGHVHSPTTVPYRANIDALKRLGVTKRWRRVILLLWSSSLTERSHGKSPSLEPGAWPM